jgi:D-alanyl-D-alanine dipeptidase
MKKNFRLFLFSFSLLFIVGNTMALPNDFVYLADIDASIIQDMKYFTHDNFIGRPIKGYQTPHCILTRQAATALAIAQQQLKPQSLSLKVFDCYRPQMAVNDFIRWSQDPTDQKMKASYYPRVNKADFFTLGYVGAKSGHTRGSTVDLTIVQIRSKQSVQELNMGTHFDFMDELSHVLAENIQGEPRANRLFLQHLMQQAGFNFYENEWWHFTLKDEPYPETYFNFPVK